MTGLQKLLVITVLLLPLTVARAAIMETYEAPDTTIASNTVIDIIEHAGGVWLATGQGLNFSLDGGDTWLLYNTGNGLVQNDISALLSFKGRLWVAGAYTEIINGGPITFSDTIQYTDDLGQTFETIELDQAGAQVPFALGAQKTVFDMAASEAQGDDWVFFTAFAGGFVGSRDGGESWRRLYASRTDSVNFIRFYTDPTDTAGLSLRSRAFSCVADSSHGDSMFAFVGTADGVLQYIYAPKEEKPNSKYVTDIVVCEDCPGMDSAVIFIGGENGVTRGALTGRPFHSAFVADGLPGPFVSDLYTFGGRVFAATLESRDGIAAGLGVSDDAGETFTPVGPVERIHDMVALGDRLYLSAETAGLWVSADTGDSWSHIFVDSTDTTAANRRNVVWGLEALGDTLYVGTDSGLVALFFDPSGGIDSTWQWVFQETAFSSGTRVIDVFAQVFEDTLGNYDSLAVWTINRALTATGAPSVFRFSYQDLVGDTLLFPSEPFQPGVLTYDLEIIGDTVFAVGAAGARWSIDGTNPSTVYRVRDTTSVDRFDNDTMTVMTVYDGMSFVGSSGGFAINPLLRDSLALRERYRIFRPNLDSLSADAVLQHTSANAGISGGFIPAMGLQYVDGDEYGRIWLSCQLGASAGDEIGMSVGHFVLADTAANRYRLDWEQVVAGQFAWNFGFNGDTVFAAADTGGVLASFDGDWSTWVKIPIVDTSGRSLIDPGVTVYTAKVIGNELWVGSDQATVVMDLATLISTRSLYYIDSSSAADEVYAYPVPLRLSSGGVQEFHFTVEQTARVTLEIYDAAMNLVYRVIDNEEFAPGVYQGRQTGVPTWDGRNGRGDEVAVGVYYFKVEYSTGEVRWGKLAVIP